MSVVDTKIPKLGILSDVAGRVADCDSDISELKWQPIAVGGAAALCEIAQSCRALCDPTDCSPARLLCAGDSPGKNTGLLEKGKDEDSMKWFLAFEAILEIRYHFTPADNKLEPIIDLIKHAFLYLWKLLFPPATGFPLIFGTIPSQK